MTAYFDALRRYFDFSSRSTRSQFWLYTLTLFVLLLVCAMIDIALGFDTEEVMPVTGLVNLLHLIPTLAVTVRRLHDTDRTGAWLLLGLVPIVGTVVLLVFLCLPSTSSNRFGVSKNDANAFGQNPTRDTMNLDQLEKLASLRASGAIDEAEFGRMKADLLTRRLRT